MDDYKMDFDSTKMSTLSVLSKIGVDPDEEAADAYRGIRIGARDNDQSYALAYCFYAFMLEVARRDSYRDATRAFRENMREELKKLDAEAVDRTEKRHGEPEVPDIDGYARVVASVDSNMQVDSLDVLLVVIRAFILGTGNRLDSVKEEAVEFNHRILATIVAIVERRAEIESGEREPNKFLTTMLASAGDVVDRMVDGLSRGVNNADYLSMFPDGDILMPIHPSHSIHLSLDSLKNDVYTSPGMAELRFASVVESHPYTMAKYADTLGRLFLVYRVLEELGFVPEEDVKEVKEAFEGQITVIDAALSSADSIENVLMSMVIKRLKRKLKGDTDED